MTAVSARRGAPEFRISNHVGSLILCLAFTALGGYGLRSIPDSINVISGQVRGVLPLGRAYAKVLLHGYEEEFITLRGHSAEILRRRLLSDGDGAISICVDTQDRGIKRTILGLQLAGADIICIDDSFRSLRRDRIVSMALLIVLIPIDILLLFRLLRGLRSLGERATGRR